MESTTLDEVLERGEKTVPEIIYEAVKESGLESAVFGVKEVKSNVISALFKAAFLSRRGYIPMVLLTGPSASGKTEIIKAIRKLYYSYIRDKRQLYTLQINNKTCPYNENPFNILRSNLPFDLELREKQKYTAGHGLEICSTCVQNLSSLHMDKKSMRDMDIQKEDYYTKMVLAKVKAAPVLPKLSSMALGDAKFKEKFYEVIKNANRGVLLINADKSRVSEIVLSNYQFLIDMYDNNVYDPDGNHVPLDMLVIIHSNETFLEDLNGSDRKFEESRPLMDRIIDVKVRRNLSYTEEEKIYTASKLPFERVFPNAMKYLSILNVLSRLNPSDIASSEDDYDDMQTDNMLDVLDLYDSGKLEKLNSSDLSRGTFQLLQELVVNESDIEKGVLEGLIMDEESKYRCGWSSGISARLVTELLSTGACNGNRGLTFLDFFRFIYDNKSRMKESGDAVIGYMKRLVNADIRSSIDYALLKVAISINCEGRFGEYVKKLEEFISMDDSADPKARKPEDVKKEMDKLPDIINVDLLRNTAKQYMEAKGYDDKKINIDLRELIKFAYRYNEENFDFIKKDIINKEYLKDKKSVLYSSVKEIAEKEFGYWDTCFEQAIKVYGEGKEVLCPLR